MAASSRLRVSVYNRRVTSAYQIARQLGGKVLKIEGSRFRPRMRDRIINWGRSANVPLTGGSVLNHPSRVQSCVDKRTTLQILNEQNVRVPPYTCNVDEARQWLNDGNLIFARTLTAASGGRGIVMCKTMEDFVRAPLYTKYVPKKHEYRVHIMKDSNDEYQVIDIQQKKRRRGFDRALDNTGGKIRSYTNGWVFCRDELTVPEDVKSQAVAAIKALGLDFGAADIGWNERRKEAHVYEVNTAPRVTNSTLTAYVRAFKQRLGRG